MKKFLSHAGAASIGLAMTILAPTAGMQARERLGKLLRKKVVIATITAALIGPPFLTACSSQQKQNVVVLPPPPDRFEVPAPPAIVAANFEQGIKACIRGPAPSYTLNTVPDGNGGFFMNIVAMSDIVPPTMALKARPAGTLINLEFPGAQVGWELVNRLKAWAAGNITCVGSSTPS